MLVSPERGSEQKTLLNRHEAHTTCFLPERALRTNKANLPGQTPSWKKAAAHLSGPGFDIRWEKRFSLLGVYSDVAKGAGGKQKQMWSASRDKFLFSLFLCETCINGLQVHHTGMGGTSAPHQCCILLQLQLYSHQFWPQNTFRKPVEHFCWNSVSHECKLTSPLPWPYVFLIYFSFKQTMTTFERNEILSFC